ncbi:MAG: site-2 protease family protein [Myxococcales bacterium]|nr:site-2 protease family protein [Myxococcales bacterium]
MRYVYAIIALGLLVAFHELGHLIAARVFGIKVLRFSVGFGPALFRIRRGETDYTLGALPLGGFVRIHGMNPHQEGLDRKDPRSFAARPAWQRLLVLLAGSLANYLLAVAVMAALLWAGTHVPVPRTIGAVVPGSEAARAQLRPGDVVEAIDGAPLSDWSELVERVNDSPGLPLVLSVSRGGERFQLAMTPRPEPSGVGRLGLRQQYVYREHGFGEGAAQSFAHVNRLAADGLRLLWRLLRGRPGVELAGPLGIVEQASKAASTGADAFLRVLVAISVALALFNLLPVPALDGGRSVFVLLELVSRRRVDPKLEAWLHTAGFLLLLGLLLWVMAQDVRRAVSEGEGAASPDAGAAATDSGVPQVFGE